MIAHISAVKIDAESGNLMKNSVSDGKTVAHATEFASRDPSVWNVITVLVSNFQEMLLVY